MGTIGDKLTYLNGTKELIKRGLNNLGGGLTNEPFRDYVDVLDDIYDKFPKVTGTGEEVELETIAGLMDVDVFGRTTQNGEPTPENPIEIENVEGTLGKNLYNKFGDFNYPTNKFADRTVLQENGTIKTTANYRSNISRGIRLPNLKANTTYVVSGELISSTGTGTNYIGMIQVRGYSNDWVVVATKYMNTLDNFSFTFNTGDYTDFFVSLNTSGSDLYATYESIYDNIQVEEGSTATEYEPYQKTVKIKVHNKNFAWQGWAEDCVNRINDEEQAKIEEFDNKHCLKFLPSTGYGDYDNKYIFKTNFKENTRYTFAFNIYSTASSNNMTIHYTDGTKFAFGGVASNTWSVARAISAENKTVKYITSAYYSGIKYLDLDSFMVLEGAYTTENMPDYVESKEQTILFPLQENQKLMEGDYLAEDGVHHVKGQAIYDGTENWQAYTGKDTDSYYCYWVATPSDCIVSHDVTGLLLANLLKEGTWDNIYARRTDTQIIALRDNGRFYIRILYSTVEALKTFLTTHNLQIEYTLAEETIEAYTTEQQTAYNQLKSLMSYENYTYVYTETEGLHPILNVTALAAWESLIQ